MNDVIFSIKEVEGSKKYLVQYPDGTVDVMKKREILEYFSISFTSGGGAFSNEDEAGAFAIEQDDEDNVSNVSFLDDDFEDDASEMSSKPAKKKSFTTKDSGFF